jgi:NTE family protein
MHSLVQSDGKVGLVLSGGGVRGAYEVGVLMGIVEALGLGPDDPSPFHVYAGTSVGAINAAFMVAHADEGDLAIGKLATIWKNLTVTSHLRLNVRRSSGESIVPRRGILGRSFIDARPLELLVRRSADFDKVNQHIEAGLVKGLLIAAFDIAAGRTTIFAHLAPDSEYRPTNDTRRRPIYEPITADHVLASAAIPLVFPARKLGTQYYCDGGVRFNTPIAPAIRAGSDKLVVVSLQRTPTEEESDHKLDDYPSGPLIAGKLLNSLLLDPFEYDLSVLARFNRVVQVLEETLTTDEMERVQAVLIESRGAPYRRLEPLVFTPSADIGELAGEHLRTHLDSWNLSLFPRFLLRRASRQDATWEADWAAYLLFEGAFAEQLIELGLADARRRAEDIRDFFARPVSAPPGKPAQGAG